MEIRSNEFYKHSSRRLVKNQQNCIRVDGIELFDKKETR
jgi:hypothetical protein